VGLETLTYDAEPERPAGAETDGALAPPRRGEGAGRQRPNHCNLKTDGRWTYTWDAADRLVKMESIAFTQNASPPLAAVNVPAKVIEFTYDGLSRRIRKKVTEGASTIAVWEAFIYDGWNMVLSVKLNPAAGTTQGRPLGGASAQATRYVWGPDIGSKPFARRDWQAAGGVRGLLYAKSLTGSNGFKIPVSDAMGNVTSVHLITYTGSASYAQRTDFVYDYDAFGKETRSSALVAGLNPDSFPFHYSTKFTDGETGLSYYGYRFYDPANGRWINRDPIGERGGANIYGMVGNNGVSQLDILGLALTTLDNPATIADVAPLVAELGPGANATAAAAGSGSGSGSGLAPALVAATTTAGAAVVGTIAGSVQDFSGQEAEGTKEECDKIASKAEQAKQFSNKVAQTVKQTETALGMLKKRLERQKKSDEEIEDALAKCGQRELRCEALRLRAQAMKDEIDNRKSYEDKKCWKVRDSGDPATHAAQRAEKEKALERINEELKKCPAK
jgi:RHS repeat-associated protein